MFVELGADRALNLDGGGSSAMFIADEGGIVNSPSGGRWEAKLGLGARETREARARRAGAKMRQRSDGVEEVFVRGNEREVMNHIGIVAPRRGAAPPDARGAPKPAAAAGPVVVVERPRPPSVRFGRAREFLYPVAFVVAAVSPLVALALFWRWRRRRVRMTPHPA
jgi:hypothetical protein